MPDGSADFIEKDRLERGFRRLSVEHRTVLVLRYYIDLQIDTVAEVLGIPVGTVKSRLHSAHDALRGALEADARKSPIPAPSEIAR